MHRGLPGQEELTPRVARPVDGCTYVCNRRQTTQPITEEQAMARALGAY